MLDARADIPGLLWAYRFREDGSAERLPDPVRREETQSRDGWLWLHFAYNDLRAQNFIASLPDLPQAARTTLLKPDEHLSLGVTDGVAHGVIADLQREVGADTREIGRLRFAFDDHLVVSARRHPLRSVDLARQAIEEGRGHAIAVGLIETIVEQFASATGEILTELSDELDQIEDHVLADTLRDDRRKLLPVRRMTVRMHRQLLALRELFRKLDRASEPRLPKGLAATAERLAHRFDALDHDAVVLQERARLLHDEIDTKINSETNRHLHALSIITALALPATFVTGFFGMNTKDLPLTQMDGGWIIGTFLCVAASAATYWALKRAGILS
ncbi:transporter [Terrarubrum flagellatum]|uniref:transporter n=1 Tax=Terrirubrum flagellatum TaxID=2895980 RepID=UPI003145525D